MITRLIQAMHEPLLIDPRMGAALASIFARKLAGQSFSGPELHAELQIAQPGSRSTPTAGRIAVIPIVGMVAQRAHSLGASTEEIGASFEAALVSKHVDAILFDVDSPGGTVTGVPELAARIAEARKVKPTLAIANGLAASAAYWIGSAADEFWVSPSGMAGSIGVYTVHEDWTAALEQKGVKVTPISAGKFKTEGAPWAPLSEEAQTVLQGQVDEVYDWFVKAVATHRRDSQANVRAGYGEGRVLGAEQAVKAGLADKVGTIDQAVARLAHRVSLASGGMRASVAGELLALDEKQLVA